MDRHPHPEELFTFPCDHVFKAFGENSEAFVEAVRQAVDTVTPVSLDHLRVRPSSGGKYVCVSVLVRLHNFGQLEAIYAALRRVDDLRYLL